MTAVALYRKYRPETFDDLVGQDSVVSLLKSAIDKDKITHAYLFVGSKGVGKTTTARIFAKELGISDKDLYELDAASNRKIDNFRDLNDSVHSLPFESKYKLYIIDEVHMLTKEAFNAFLKTLEEPPEHVIFILATTEAEKLPDTIKSRCQIVNFQKANEKAITTALQNIAKHENLHIDPDAITAISIMSEGSFRDAIGMLQKAITVSDGKTISAKDVEKSMNIAPVSEVLNFLSHIHSQNLKSALEQLRELSKNNINPEYFIQTLIYTTRQIIIMRYQNDSTNAQLAELYTSDTFSKLQALSKEALNINSKLLRAMIESLADMQYLNNGFLSLELLLFDYLKNK